MKKYKVYYSPMGGRHRITTGMWEAGEVCIGEFDTEGDAISWYMENTGTPEVFKRTEKGLKIYPIACYMANEQGTKWFLQRFNLDEYLEIAERKGNFDALCKLSDDLEAHLGTRINLNVADVEIYNALRNRKA